MHAPSFEVKNPAWVKVAIVLGTALFAVLAVGSAWQAYVEPLLALRALQGVVAIFFGWLAAVGGRLLTFINFKLEVDESSVTLQTSNESYSFGWTELRLRDRSVLRFTEVRDRQNRILFAVDWYADNARRFVQTHAQRSARDEVKGSAKVAARS